MTAKKKTTKPAATAIDPDALDTEIHKALKDAPLALKTLRGDIRDALVEVFRKMTKPFDQCSEFEKRDIAGLLNNVALDVINQGATILTSQNRPHVMCSVKSINVADGLKITLEAPYNLEALDMLAMSKGMEIMVVGTQARKSDGQRKKEPGQPEQAEMENLTGDEGSLDKDTKDGAAVDKERGEAAQKKDAEKPLPDPSKEADKAK